MTQTTETHAPILPATPTGYTTYDDYIAQRTVQGDRTHYTIALPLAQVPMVLPVPDPDQPLEDNRQIREGHARAFGDYIRYNVDWHAGPLTVRTTSGTVRFQPFQGGDYGTLQVGLLRVPRNNRDAFRIVDGQHRVLGIQGLFELLNRDLVDARGRAANAARNGEPAQARAILQNKVDELQETLDRVTKDSIGVDLLIEDSPDKARQIFVDVANNALGISKSVTKRFDSRTVINRALNVVLDDPDLSALLDGKVDQEKDRITGSNPNLLGAGHLADIIRVLAVGTGGRVTHAQEVALDERALAAETNDFFEVLTSSFPVLDDIANGTVQPGDVRDSSLLVSTTMLRVLAGVYYRLKGDGLSDSQVVSFFKKLAKHMDAPIDPNAASGQLWLNATPRTEAFAAGATAPGARLQQVKELVEVITGWATSPPAELKG